MKTLLEFITTVLLTLLPSRYRSGSSEGSLRWPAIICSAVQIVVCVFALILRLSYFAAHDPGLPPIVAGEIFSRYGDVGLMETGPFILVEFWMKPANLVLLYFFIEGVVRFFAALAAHQVLGTAPLCVISLVHRMWSKAQHRRYIGPLVVDEVVRGGKQGWNLKVYSCRPKLHWNRYITVEFEGEYYQLLNEEIGPAPRRFVYYFRKNPPGLPVVVIDRYQGRIL